MRIARNMFRISVAGATARLMIGAFALTALSWAPIQHRTRAAVQTPDNSLADLLRYMRTEIEVYRNQHDGVCPGYRPDPAGRTPDVAAFVAQLTQYTDAAGKASGVRSGTACLGPYLAVIPTDPLNYSNGVLIVDDGAFPPADSTQPYGWMFCPRTQQLVANVDGVDSNGVAYSSY